ncbi:ABC transporter permease [Parapedobacter koreensis]|uniref:ABC-type antimicrobial peptide transport system, permease component n=1 Tax=Parapedobacter koreensis TaxID=332977 RepID=A0A1H7R1P2_9SPHI|nr:ABC transporter permease [Parapedobacter koreensis]SEL54156.1 ABC-type antimicrobial peptide transport system, permease component [Parapedobacter koreensis]
MIKNYFKIAWRNLWNNKGYSALNIGGLALGMAAAILILLWIQNEVSFDMFHSKKDRLYIAANQAVFNGELNTWFSTPKPLGPALQAEFPEIVRISRYSSMGPVLMTVGDKKLKGNGIFVDSAFLQMFDFPLIQGNANNVLTNTTNVVITQSLAKRLFGNEDAIGKTIRLDTIDLATVSGVMADMPGNTRFRQAEFFMPWAYMEKLGMSDNFWGNNSVSTYIELTPGASIDDVNKKIRDITIRHSDGREDNEVFLYALPNWWLYTKFVNGKMAGGRIDMVQAFLFVAAFVLLIACINFMNLSTARSEKRAKEVGVRKVAGAYRHSLIGQFLCESVLIAFIGGVLALGIVWLSLPAFGELVDRRLFIDFASPIFWVSFLSFILLTGTLAGSYPAFFLSSFQPVKVLKGTFKRVNAAFNPRKVLVVTQFTVAIALVVSTIVIQRQVQHGKDRENGYSQNNLVYIFEEGLVAKNSTLIKNELLNSGVAESVTRTSAPLTEGWSNSWAFSWQGKRPDDKTVFDRFCADDHIVKTAGLTLVAGRDFDLSTYPTDSLGIILSESAAKAMGFEDPIGQPIQDNGKDWHVIGVIKDFILRSPFEPIPPMVIEGAAGWFNAMHIKFNPALTTSEALSRTEAIFKRYNPEFPFEYSFVDEAYRQKFEETQTYGTLAALFTFITIAISCLGLFALAAYMAENRTKEIGVRKVLGASVFSIAKLLSKEFVILVLIACLVAFPFSYWFMDRYFLHMYTYRAPISWGIFVLTGTGALVLALATVSSQAIKAALANPVDSLRDE